MNFSETQGVLSPNLYNQSIHLQQNSSCQNSGFSLSNLDFSFTFPNISTVFLSLKDYISKPNELAKKLCALSKTNTTLNDDDIDLIVKAFKSDNFKELSPHISKIFVNQTNEQLNIILKKVFVYSDDIDPLKMVEKVKSLLTLQKIESIIKSEFKNFNGIDEALRVAKMSSKEIDRKAEEDRMTIVQTIQVTVENLLEFVIDTVLKAFQIDSIGEETEDDSQAYYRVMIFTSLWGGFTSILVSLHGVIGSVALTGIIASSAVFALVIGIVCYYKWLKPTPKECSPFINLTTEAKKGILKEVKGRDTEMKEIMDALVSNKGLVRRHPLVVAKSGCGKTTTAQGIAVKIARGGLDVPEELRGKEVFYVNIAKLCNDNTSIKMGKSKVDVLSKIQKKMLRYKGQCLFIFDEVHTAFKDPNNQLLAENLKTLLDPGPGGFPYCLALTTEYEYNKYIAIKEQWPFVRRTKMIPMGPTEQMATKLILYHMAKQQAPEVEIDKSVFDNLHQLTTDVLGSEQPTTSQQILNDAIGKIRENKSSSIHELISKYREQINSKKISQGEMSEADLQKREEALKVLEDVLKEIPEPQNLKNLSIQSAIQILQQKCKEYEEIYNAREDKRTYTIDGIALFDAYKANEELLVKLQAINDKEQQNYNKYFEWKHKQLLNEENLYSQAIKIANMSEGKNRDNNLIKFILYNYYITQSLIAKVKDEYIAFQENYPNAKTKIDLDLINQIIDEHRKRRLNELNQSKLHETEESVLSQNEKALINLLLRKLPNVE